MKKLVAQKTPELPGQLPLPVLLGLRDIAGLDRAFLRSLQYDHLAGRSRLRVFGHAVGALVGMACLMPYVPLPLIAGWIAVLTGGVFYFARMESAMVAADLRKVTDSDANRHLVGSAWLGLTWMLLPIMLFFYAGEAGMLRGFALVAVIVVGVGTALAVVPLRAIVFIAPACIASTVCFALRGDVVMTSISAVYFFANLLTVSRRAESFLRAGVAETAMQQKSETVSLLLREFEENEADWLWQIDRTRLIRSVSPRFAFALGSRPEQIEGKPFFEVLSGDSWDVCNFAPSLRVLADRIKARESFSNLIVQVWVGGHKRWWELSGTPMLDERGQEVGFRGVGSDVTEQRKSSEKIAYLARYDTLTGLPNRLMLNESLGQAMDEARQWRRRCAFIMLDLDRFKAVNDSLGHQIGDRLLEQVSRRLSELTGENEICGRLGGDEFAIVMRDAPDSCAVDALARKVIERLSQPYEVDQHTLFVGASAGSALAPRDGKTVEELMRNADLALYRAKDGGRGVHFAYEPSLHADAEERRQLEFSLRKALEKDELLLNFQPVVDANSERVVSFEALVRWQSEDHGFVSPGKFIPVAEDTRLIVPIGTWVMQQACREAMAWPRGVKVNVNVSPEQLMEPDFADTVVDALTRSGLDPQRLEIEVTESIFLGDAEIARQALAKVMALGCQVALDDFGTGYSSLGYLRKLQFSTIKVDRSFVQGAAQGSSESLAIVRAVVAMAKSLEMKTTAEGVETEDEARLVCRMGCDRIQGFYFGRPMSSADARSLFSDDFSQLRA
ncbi:EAL domain-containing protein [Citromicrobium bathyomarinum]